MIVFSALLIFSMRCNLADSPVQLPALHSESVRPGSALHGLFPRLRGLHSLTTPTIIDYPVQVTESKQTRSLFKELSIALIAAVFLGFGSLFLLLWVGIYV